MVDRKEQIEFWGKVQAKRKRPEHPVIQAMVQPKIELIKKFISLDGKAILDVGTGNGYFAYYLSKYTSVVGIDISEPLLRTNPVLQKVKCDAQSLPFKDSSFDIVISSNLLHHLNDPKEAVSEMRRVSRRYVILSDANRNNPFLFLYALIKRIERGCLNISEAYLSKILSDLNMRIIFCSNTGFIVPNLLPVSLLKFFQKFEGIFVCIFGGIYSIAISDKG
jgi:SAM-dependent methyltransferase